jgi:hypothetical protein
MHKKRKPEIPKEVKTIIDKFAKSLLDEVEGKVLLPSVIEYLMEKLGYSGNPEIKPLFIFTKALPQLVVGSSKKYWTNLRAAKRGPKYYLTGEKEGTWFFNYAIEANSEEEAIEKAKQEMYMEAGSIDLNHTRQWCEGERVCGVMK